MCRLTIFFEQTLIPFFVLKILKVQNSQKLQIYSPIYSPLSSTLLQIFEKCNYLSGEEGKCIHIKYQKKPKEMNDIFVHFNDTFLSLYFYIFNLHNVCKTSNFSKQKTYELDSFLNIV